MSSKKVSQISYSTNSSVNKKVMIRNILIIVLVIVVVLLGCLFFANSYLKKWPIDGQSMEPTISDEMNVLVFKTNKVKYDNIIIFKIENSNESLIKRVIGLPGDEISIRYSLDDEAYHLYRNGELLSEDYIKEKMSALGGYFEKTIIVPDGYYYVLGDNRNNSKDSHLGIYAKKELIDGVVFFNVTTHKFF